MSRKTNELYNRVVAKIKEIITFTVSEIVTDFEEALFQSFSADFSEADASGCLLHHKKATYKIAILKNGLSHLYSSNKQFNNWFQQLMNLPLPPSGKIIETYHLLKDAKPELLHSDNERVRIFFIYYEKYWLRKSVQDDFLYSKRKNEQQMT